MRRNKVVFSGEFNPPNTLLLEAEMAQMEFRKANSLTNQPNSASSATEAEKWVPPPRNTVKINWDASVDTANKVIGMGYIARDDKGRFLAAVSKQERLVMEPVVAETLAALNAVLWCQE
jgi:hypothetical protein